MTLAGRLKRQQVDHRANLQPHLSAQASLGFRRPFAQMAEVEYNRGRLTIRAGDRRNCNLNLDTSPRSVQTYPASPSSEGRLLANFHRTGQRQLRVSCAGEGCKVQG